MSFAHFKIDNSYYNSCNVATRRWLNSTNKFTNFHPLAQRTNSRILSKEVLQYFIPLLLILQHNLAQNFYRRFAIVQQLIMEFLQREIFSFLFFIIFAQLQD